MALSGLDIYKLLPKTNCKECGFATCLAFAMALAQKKISLDKCPHVTSQVRELLESASQPPVKLVTIGTGERRLEIGNETVMHRHEEKFHHPAGVGFLIDDTLSDDEMDGRLAKIRGLKFERVGQTIRPDLVCARNASCDRDRFVKTVKRVKEKSDLNIILFTKEASMLAEALKMSKERRPLVIWDKGGDSLGAFIKVAKENNVPLAVSAASLEEAAALTDEAKKGGIGEIVINMKSKMANAIQDFTYIRRTALKKNFRPFGYPIMAFAGSEEPGLELAEAASCVMKYASIVIVKNVEKDFVFPLLVARQDIYADPQKPVQVEPKVYEIGRVTKESPVLVTTNFSITYFTVAGEVESSKVPSYIICCDSEGMSVLTAWAAEKFTAEKIAETMNNFRVEGIVSHRKVVIPGYVAVLSSKLEELSHWKVQVGPREASGIPAFLKNWR